MAKRREEIIGRLFDFDAERSAKKRDAAIQAVGDSHSQWVARCVLEIATLAKHNDTLTTDDVWKVMATQNAAPREPRAMGSAMRTAARAGWIRATNEYRPTDAVQAHRRPIRVWKSTVSRG
jgi:hypothetical protein